MNTKHSAIKFDNASVLRGHMKASSTIAIGLVLQVVLFTLPKVAPISKRRNFVFMSYAETGSSLIRTHDHRALDGAEYGKWASDFAHAYYALVKGEADLGDLMDQGYELWQERMHDSPLDVAQERFDAIPCDMRARYLAGGEAYEAFERWQASLAD